MKDFLPISYTFSPAGSGVGSVRLDIAGFDIKRLVAIINQTKGQTIYATGVASLRYSAVSGNLITLFFDTASHSADDVLQVIYNDENPLAIAIDSVSIWLKSIMRAVQYPNYLDRALNALRVNIVNSLTIGTLPTLANVTTVAGVTTVTNQTNIGSYNADVQVRANVRQAWYASVRARIE
jgi:hypothetical protein